MADTLTRAQAITILRNLGWRIRSTAEFTQAVRLYQGAYNLGKALGVDGKVGPKTSDALRRSEARRRAGKGTLSEHFSATEFRCKCGGRYSGCKRVVVARALLRALEVYRSRVGSVSVVSGYRCVGHNKAVGGARNSQHMYGNACDIGYRLSDRQVADLGVFSGIGRSASTHKVRHVDVRSTGGHNLTGGSTSRPTIWNYAV